VREERDNIITGRNPVIEALKAQRDIEKICIARGAEGSIKKIEAMASEGGVPVYYEDRRVIDRISPDNNQGVVAYVSEYRYCETEDILMHAEGRGEKPFIVLLDGIEDPRNLGAIMRTAEGAGAHGIIIPKRRAAGVGATVQKASAGAAEHILCARVSNIAQTIDKLKNAGVFIAACDPGGELYYRADLRGGIGLVIGGEGTGVGNLIKRKCDFSLAIPMMGKMESLNAGSAAAILMYEVRRQRDG